MAKTVLAVGAGGVVALVERSVGGADGFGLVYLPIVVAAAWGIGLWTALGVVAVTALARGGLGLSPSAVVVAETVMLAVIGGSIAKIRSDRLRTERFRKFVHGLLERQARTARRDPLTELTNRRGFYERLHVEFARWERGGPPFGVIYLDVDNFKQVNDRFGHDRGDALLVEIAECIESNVKETDVPARIGGDEFVVLCWNATAEILRGVAERLADRLGDLGERFEGIDLGVSLGVACFDRPPEDVEEVVRLADDAMYRAKGSPRTDVVVRDVDLEVRS